MLFSFISDILGIWNSERNHFNGSLSSKSCANLMSLIDNPCSLDIFRSDEAQVNPLIAIFTARHKLGIFRPYSDIYVASYILHKIVRYNY